jgi:hypothetical protein
MASFGVTSWLVIEVQLFFIRNSFLAYLSSYQPKSLLFKPKRAREGFTRFSLTVFAAAQTTQLWGETQAAAGDDVFTSSSACLRH